MGGMRCDAMRCGGGIDRSMGLFDSQGEKANAKPFVSFRFGDGSVNLWYLLKIFSFVGAIMHYNFSFLHHVATLLW
jgi:hypothetical protein